MLSLRLFYLILYFNFLHFFNFFFLEILFIVCFTLLNHLINQIPLKFIYFFFLIIQLILDHILLLIILNLRQILRTFMDKVVFE